MGKQRNSLFFQENLLCKSVFTGKRLDSFLILHQNENGRLIHFIKPIFYVLVRVCEGFNWVVD